MENEELLTSPEEETDDSSQFTDDSPEITAGEPEVSDDVLQNTEALLSAGDYNVIAVKSIPIGALCGAIFMIVGFAYLGIVHIFKKL